MEVLIRGTMKWGDTMKHKWKAFATLIDAPYRKRFSTDGYGEFRIDNNGLYSYESKEYDSENIELFLIGEIHVVHDMEAYLAQYR